MKRVFSFLVIIVLFFTPHTVFAVAERPSEDLRRSLVTPSNEEFNDAVKHTQDTGNINNEAYNLGTWVRNSHSWTDILIGGRSTDGESVIQGVVPQMGNMMAAMITHPPANTGVWIADLLEHSPFVPQAYAQGIGFKSLSPILQVWKAFRDIAYIFFVLAFMYIGFMIMFRQKWGGQTAVTITSAIPNFLWTALAITFSFAISGFLIDIMYLMIYLIIGIFKLQNLLPPTLTDPLGQPITLEKIALSNNIFSNGLQLIFGGGSGNPTAGAALSVGKLVEGFFSSKDSNIYLQGLGKIANVSGAIIAELVFAIVIFFSVTQTFFKLLMSYVKFIISVIFSPILLLLNLFTGKLDFSEWLRSLFATLLPFPVVITMIFLAMVLGGQSETKGVGYKWIDGTDSSQAAGFQAPQISTFWADSKGIGAIQGLIAIGILMLMPEAIDISLKMLGNPKSPFDQYIPKISANLQKGWKGGKLVDGLDWTDTTKLPYGGVSGENILKKGAVGVGAAADAGKGAFISAGNFVRGTGTDPFVPIQEEFKKGGHWAANKVGDTTFADKKDATKKS
ncbi:MAG: hypothetical protein HZA34_03030 [Candidatus Pacebacteria bacterium]|nr:hypothetical protein [Candidatus Paceibacterota bacterium]